GPDFFRLLDRLGAARSWPTGIAQGVVCAQGRERRCVEAADGGRVLCGGLSGDRLDLVPASLAEFSSLRQHLCWREPVGSYGQAGPRLWLADAGSILLPATSDGSGSSARLHVVDGRVHDVDFPALYRGFCGCARLIDRFQL